MLAPCVTSVILDHLKAIEVQHQGIRRDETALYILVCLHSSGLARLRMLPRVKHDSSTRRQLPDTPAAAWLRSSRHIH